MPKMTTMTTVQIIHEHGIYIGLITPATGICCAIFKENFGPDRLISTDRRTGVVGFAVGTARDGGSTAEANYCPFCGSPIHILNMGGDDNEDDSQSNHQRQSVVRNSRAMPNTRGRE